MFVTALHAANIIKSHRPGLTPDLDQLFASQDQHEAADIFGMICGAVGFEVPLKPSKLPRVSGIRNLLVRVARFIDRPAVVALETEAEAASVIPAPGGFIQVKEEICEVIPARELNLEEETSEVMASGLSTVIAGGYTEVVACDHATVTCSVEPENTEPAALELEPPAAGSIVTARIWKPARPTKPFALVQLDHGFTGLLHYTQVAGTDDRKRLQRLESLCAGSELRLAVRNVRPVDGRLRIELSETMVERIERQELLKSLQVGAAVTGTVTRKELYGVFVDIGRGLTGLVHWKELPGFNPEGQQRYLSDQLRSGMQITVTVVSIEADGKMTRISLSLRRNLQNQLVQDLERSGKVTRGSVLGSDDGFYRVDVGHGAVGLLPWGALKTTLKKGDHVKVRVATVRDDGSFTLSRLGV